MADKRLSDDVSSKDAKAVVLTELGEALIAAGRLDDAKRAFDEALQFRRQLMLDEPNNPNWPRDASVSLNNLGEVCVEMGDLKQARQMYLEALRVVP